MLSYFITNQVSKHNITSDSEQIFKHTHTYTTSPINHGCSQHGRVFAFYEINHHNLWPHHIPHEVINSKLTFVCLSFGRAANETELMSKHVDLTMRNKFITVCGISIGGTTSGSGKGLDWQRFSRN